MTRNNVRMIPKRIIALLLAVMTVVSFATNIVFADNELSLQEGSVDVTGASSRAVLYNAGELTSAAGYDTVIGGNELTLTKTINESSLNEWLTALQNKYYSAPQYSDNTLNDGKTGTETIGYTLEYVSGTATERELTPIGDTELNPVYSDMYYYIVNGQAGRSGGDGLKYLSVNENNAIVLSREPMAWLVKASDTDDTTATDFSFIPVTDTSKALTISGSSGSYTISLEAYGPTENQLFVFDKCGTYWINSKDVENGNIHSSSLSNAYLDAVSVKDGTGDAAGCSKRGGNNAFNWFFEPIPALDKVYPKVDYVWSSSDPTIADISSAGDVVIYKDGNVTFTCTATADIGLSAASSDQLDSLPLSKSFSATYTFNEHEATTKDNPLSNTTENAGNFPAAGEPGSVIISKNASGDQTGYDTTGVAEVQLSVESLTVEEPIDVVLVIDVSRSMVAFHDYDAVFCAGTRTETLDDNNKVVSVAYSGSRDITYVIKKGSLIEESETDYEVPVYDLGGDIVYYCRYNAADNTYSLIQKIEGDDSSTADVTEDGYEVAVKTGADIKAIAPDGYYCENNPSSDEYIKNYNKLNAARTSAVTFVETLLNTSPDSRIALVQFADDGAKSGSTNYAVNSRVITNYTSDKDELIRLINNTATDSDNRYAQAGAGASYYRYSPTNSELDTLEANLNTSEAGIGLTLSNKGGTNYGLAFQNAESVISLDNSSDTEKNDRQIVLFMTDGGPNTLNLAADSILSNGNESLNNVGKVSESWAYFALRRQMQAKVRIENLGYEIISIAFDLDSDSAAYFAPYTAGAEYSVDDNTTTNTIKTSLVDDLAALGYDVSSASSESELLTALRTQIVKSLATYEAGFEEVDNEGSTTDYSGLNDTYKKIAESLIVKTTETEVTDVIGKDYELRLLPYNGTNSQIVIYSQSVSYDGAGNAAYGAQTAVETFTFTGGNITDGFTYTDTYVDADGVTQERTGTISASGKMFSGEYFDFYFGDDNTADSTVIENNTFVWHVGDVADKKFTFTYDAYLTGSDPAYEIAMGRADDNWLTDGADTEFAAYAADQTLPTNESADIVYKNFAGEYCTQTYGEPKLGWDVTSVTVSKIWNDNDDAGAVRPAEVKVQLMVSENGGTAYEVYNTATLTGPDWTYTWDNLPRYSDGKALTYSVREVDTHAAYDDTSAGSGSSFTITNDLVTYDVTVNYVDRDNNTIKPFETPYNDYPRGEEYDVIEKGCRPGVITVGDTDYYFVEKLEGDESGELYDNENIIYVYTPVEAPSIVKKASTDLIKITDENGTYKITYTLTVTNPNTFDISSVKVTDVLPDGLAFADGTASVKLGELEAFGVNGQTLNITLGTVPASGSNEVYFDVILSDRTATAKVGSEAPYTNGAEITAISVDPDEDGTPTEIPYTPAIPAEPVTTDIYRDPEITKAADKDKAAEGETVTYTIEVTNTSSVTLYDLVVTDVIPAGMTPITTGNNVEVTVAGVTEEYADVEPSFSVSGNTLTVNIPCIAAGGKATIKLYVTITDPTKLTYVNTASIEQGYLEPVDPDNPGESDVPKITTDEVVVRIDSAPTITKTADKDYVHAGETITYTLTVYNRMAEDIYNVNVVDYLTLANHVLTYISSTPEKDADKDGYNWTIGHIKAGESADIKIEFLVNDWADEETLIENTAYLCDYMTDSNNDGTPETTHALWEEAKVQNLIIRTPAIEKSVSPQVPIKITDDNGTYTITYGITVRNDNEFPVTNVTVTDELPAGLTYVADSVAGDEISDFTVSGNLIYFTLDLEGRSYKNITFQTIINDKTDTAKLGSTAVYVNDAEVTGLTADPDTTDDIPAEVIVLDPPKTSNEVTSVAYRAPEIKKYVDESLVHITDEDGRYVLTYTLEVINTNPFPITAVTVTDSIPEGLTYVADSVEMANLSDFNISGNDISMTVASVGADNSVRVSFQVVLSDKTDTAAIGSKAPYTNMGYITGMSFDPDGEGEVITENINITYASNQRIPSNDVTTNVYRDPEITKTADKNIVGSNENLTYTIEVENSNDYSLLNVVVSDPLPQGLTYVSSVPSGTYDPDTRTVTWTISRVAAGATAEITLTVTTAEVLNTVTNTVYIDRLTADTGAEDEDVVYPEGSKPTDSEETPVNFDLVIKYRKYDGNAEDGVGAELQGDGGLADQPYGEPYDVSSQIPDIIVVNGEFWEKKFITDTSDDITGNFYSDKEIVVVYDKINSLYSLTKQVSTDGTTWVDDAVTVKPGDTVWFRIKVTNNASYAISGLSLSDSFAVNGTAVEALPTGWDAIVAEFAADTNGQLAANGEWVSENMSYTVSSEAVNGSYAVNTATLSNTNTSIPALTDDARVNVAATSGLTIEKTADVAANEDGIKFVDAGERVKFILTVTNTGETLLRNVEVTDDSYDVVVIAADNTERTVKAGAVIETIAELAAGASEEIIVWFDVPANAAKNAEFNNSATASADDPNGGDDLTDTDNDIVVREPSRTPVVDITKEADKSKAANGDTVTYTITVENNGELPLYDLVVADKIPAGMTPVTTGTCVTVSVEGVTAEYDGVQPEISFSGDTLTVNIPCIADGGRATIELAVTITDPTKLTYVNTASIEQGYLEPVDPDNPGESDVPPEESEEVIVEISADPVIEKTVNSAYARKGDTLVYTITVTNTTADTLYDVVVTDSLPTGLTFVSSVPEREDTSVSALEWTIPSIAAGGTAEITVTATVDDVKEEPYRNTATLVSAKTDEDGDQTPETPHTYNKSDDAETVIILDPEIGKGRNMAIADLGDTVEYYLTVENPNESIDLLNVVVSDPLPQGLTYVSSTPQGVYDEATHTVTWIIGTLTAEAPAEITIVTTVSDRSEAIFCNTAYINSAVADIDKSTENTSDRPITYTPAIESNTVETDVCYDLVIEYRKYDETAEGGIGDPLQNNYESLDNLRGTEYHVGSEIHNIIIVDGEVWQKKFVTEDSAAPDGFYDDDKRIVVVYEKIDSLYTLTKEVSLDGETWQDEVTVEPGTTVYFRIVVTNNAAYPVSGISLSDAMTINGADTAIPNAWENIIAAFETETNGQLAANGVWASSEEMSYTVSPDAINSDRIVNTATLTNTDTSIPELTDDAKVNVVAESGLSIVKSANLDVSEDGKQYAEAGQRINFTLVVTNTGDTVLRNVKVTDDTYDVIVIDDGVERTVVKGSIIKTISVLEPGEREVIEVYFDIPGTAQSGEQFINTATARADDPNGGDELVSTDDETVVRTTDPLPELSIVKKVITSGSDAESEKAVTVKPGEYVTYTVTVINTGNADAENVYVVDYMLEGSTLITHDWAINDAWVIERVPAGGSYTLTAQIPQWQLPLGTPAGTVITNVAELYESQQAYEDDEEPIDTDEADVTAEAVYSIDINKTTDVAAVKPGEKIGYIVYVTNTGNAVLNDVIITDGLSGTWGELPAKTEDGKDVELTLNSDNTVTIKVLEQGETVRLSFETTVSAATSASDVVNTVTAEAEKPDGTKVTDESEAVTKVFYNQLKINKSANVETVNVGGKVIYTITVTNTGSTELTNVVVTDDLPVTVLKEYISGENNKLTEVELSKNSISVSDIDPDDYAPDTIIGYIPRFAAGECRVFTLEYIIPSTAKTDDVIWNTAEAAADGGHKDSASDDVKVVVPVVRDYKLEISKTANVTMVEAGDTVTYTITVTNTGKDTLTNVAITDSLAVTYNGTLYPAGNVIKTIETLPSGKSESIIVTYAVPKNTTLSTIKNTATAKADETEKVTDDVTVTLESPSVSITKTVNTTNPVAGQKVYYTLVVTNTGNCTLSDLLVSDPQIGYSVTIASLAPGAKWTSPSGALYYTFAAGATSGTTFKNSASVSNTKVKGSSNASASITTGGNNYITPDTGDSAAEAGTTFSTVLCVTAVAALICLITAAGLYVAKRRRKGENRA